MALNKKEEIAPIKVLTIDFDYIMWPCIKLYNDLSAEDKNPTELWNQINAMRGINNHLKYDAKALKNIVSLIKNCLKNNDCKFSAIDNHEDICGILNIDDDSNKDKYDITNIDFHHDIYYREEDRIKLTYYSDKNCSNWLGYIFFSGHLNKYNWIQAPNSDPLDMNIFDDEFKKLFEIKFSNAIKDLNDKLISGDIKFDYMVFCFSPQWVPYEYRHLYDIIVDIFGGE